MLVRIPSETLFWYDDFIWCLSNHFCKEGIESGNSGTKALKSPLMRMVEFIVLWFSSFDKIYLANSASTYDLIQDIFDFILWNSNLGKSFSIIWHE